MKLCIVTGLLSALLFASCVPRAQYDTLVTERDYYREQVVQTDSTSGSRLQSLNDSLQNQRLTEQRQIRQLEELRATNRALNGRVEELTAQYNSILEQNRAILADAGGDGNLRQELLDRQAELDRRDAELSRRDRRLQAREESLASFDRMREEQPVSYGNDTGVRGTSPVDPEAAPRLRMDGLQEELRQLMLALTDTGYVLRRPDGETLELVLGGQYAFEQAGSLSLQGQKTLRRLGGTLRNYPGLDYTIVGHAESTEADPLLAYESASARAIRVALQLAQFGLDAGSITAGTQGFYGPEDTPQLNGLDRERRVVILIHAAE